MRNVSSKFIAERKHLIISARFYEGRTAPGHTFKSGYAHFQLQSGQWYKVQFEQYKLLMDWKDRNGIKEDETGACRS